MKKVCLDCDTSQDLKEFHNRKASVDGKSSYCKTCMSKRQKKWYNALSVTRKASFRSSIKEKQLETRKKVYEYLLEHSCTDCSESDPSALQFDHVRGKKLINISTAVNSWSWSRIQTEIAKCDVRCANCHAKRTAKQRNYYKFVRM